eukprot:5453422-Amphidinium_carterae.1
MGWVAYAVLTQGCTRCVLHDQQRQGSSLQRPAIPFATDQADGKCGAQTHQGQGGVHEGPTCTHSSSTLTHIHTQQPVVTVVRCLAWTAGLTTPPLAMSRLDRVNGSHLDVRLESLSGAPVQSFLARLACDGDLSRTHLLQRLRRKHREEEEEHACRRRAESKRASRVCLLRTLTCRRPLVEITLAMLQQLQSLSRSPKAFLSSKFTTKQLLQASFALHSFICSAHTVALSSEPLRRSTASSRGR